MGLSPLLSLGGSIYALWRLSLMGNLTFQGVLELALAGLGSRLYTSIPNSVFNDVTLAA